jgi:predicted phage tail protein
MKRILILTLLLLLFLLQIACEDVLIDDLREKEVVLLSPPNNHISTQETQTFWWEHIEDAADYHIRIVSPSFNNMVTIAVDDYTMDNNYTATLSPGTYQWIVYAANNVGESESGEIRTLIVSADSTLTNQVMALVAPIDASKIGTATVTFLWQSLSLATHYRIQVSDEGFNNSTLIDLEDTTSNDFYTTTLSEGTYFWRVRAENNGSESDYTTHSVTIDLTPPTAPTLDTYYNSDTISVNNLPIDLAWYADITDAFQDSIYIYNDVNLSNLALKSAVIDTYDFSETTLGDYYWRVRSVDEVGNVGNYSNTGNFYITN